MKKYYCQKDLIPWIANYDIEKIPPFTLPDPLCCFDGSYVKTQEDWLNKRRPELLAAFCEYMYGEELPLPDRTSYKLLSEKVILNGLGVRREIEMNFSMNNGKSHSVVMLVYFPANKKDVPVFTGLTFVGNHVIEKDPEIIKTGMLDGERGKAAHRYPLQQILGRGYAIAAAAYHDFYWDEQETGWEKSVCYILFNADYNKCSAIGTWSWGISRLLDCLTEFVPEINPEKAIVYGHSRLGKTALWTMARDTRFKLACVNDSGCGGAAPNRRLYGETLLSMQIYNPFAFWFVPKLKAFAMTPEKMPIDQNELIALAAPRHIAVHSAILDVCSDPEGMFISVCHAKNVFELFGMKGPESETMPPVGIAVGQELSYYCRDGQHDMLAEDFDDYMNCADRIFHK